VSPIGIQVRPPAGVQMIELVPGPDGLRRVIGVIPTDIFHVAEINNDVPCRSRSVGQCFREGREHDHMSIGKGKQVVMYAEDGDFTFRTGGGSESGVELRRRHLPDDITAKVHLLEDAVGAIGLTAETDQEMTVWQQLDGIRARGSCKRGLIDPKNVAGQIRDYGFRSFGRRVYGD